MKTQLAITHIRDNKPCEVWICWSLTHTVLQFSDFMAMTSPCCLGSGEGGRGRIIMGSFGIHTQPGILQDCHYPSITITDTTEGKAEETQRGTGRCMCQCCIHMRSIQGCWDKGVACTLFLTEVKDLKWHRQGSQLWVWVWPWAPCTWLQTDQAQFLLKTSVSLPRNSTSSTSFTCPISASMTCVLDMSPIGRGLEQGHCRETCSKDAAAATEKLPSQLRASPCTGAQVSFGKLLTVWLQLASLRDQI